MYATDRAGIVLGFARAFSDGIFHTDLAELIVHPDYQRRGIGRQFLTAVIERYATTAIFLKRWKDSKDSSSVVASTRKKA